MTLTLLLTMLGAWGYWSVSSVPGGSGAGGGGVVGQGSTPSATVSGSSVTLSWTATSLANGQSADGYIVRRYASGTLAEQTVLTGCTGIVAATTCTETSVPDGLWLYSVTPTVGANWRGTESVKSSTVRVDTVPPGSSIAVTDITGGVHRTGTTIWYRGAAAGSFRLTNTVTDAASGPASSQTSALSGTSTGWTHLASTVSTPAGGPYVSNAFSWTAGATAAPAETVTSRDVSGNAITTTFTMANDSTAPSAGSISYPTTSSGRSVTVTFTAGTDTESGIATRVLQRAHADYESGACGTFGAFRQIGSADPASPYTDTTLGNATCYQYRYVVTDRVGNQRIESIPDVVTADYSAAVAGASSLLGHWRLGERLDASDSFTDSAVKLTKHEGELGTWTLYSGDSSQITAAGRVRRASDGRSVVLSSARPSDPDYAVESDLYYAGTLAQDAPGLVGRLDTTTGDYYVADYEMPDQSWNLWRFDEGPDVWYRLASLTGQALTVGQTYRLRFELRGSSLKLFVNDAQVLSTVDATLTAAGRAGIIDDVMGSNAPAKTDTAGLHYDNFAVRPLRAEDSKATNTGRYDGGAALELAGALAGDTDRAASFDGGNDAVIVANPVLNDFTVEAWFKSTQGLNTGAQWWYGAAIVDADHAGADNGWGVSLRADGYVVAGVGNPDVSIISAAGGYNDGVWHHVAFTRAATGGMLLYVDGNQVASGTGPTAARDAGLDLAFGRTARGASNQYVGTLDEIALYSSVLSPATIAEHYALGGTNATNSTGPSGGSVEATGLVGTGSRYSTSATLNLALAKGSDTDGLAASGARLTRASAPLTSTSANVDNGACGAFGSYTLVQNDPGTSLSDTVTSGFCYRYRYAVPDTLDNVTTYTSRVVKVDTTPPPNPTLTHYGSTSYNTATSGSTIYYDSGETAGGFFASVASSDDPESGAADYNFPSLGAGWSLTPSGDQVAYYSWSGTPAVPGTKQVTATNHAGSTSGATGFTVVADDTPPTAGTLTVADTTTSSTSVSVSFTTGTDSGAGIGTRYLQRQAAPLTGSTCGSYGGFTTVTNGTNPTSPFTETVARGFCYQYQYVVDDRVGNRTTTSSASVVKVLTYAGTVNATAGLLRYWRMGDSLITDDPLTGTAGAVLSSSDWTKHSLSNADAVFAPGDTIRKSGTSTFRALYTSTDTPTSPDYTIEAMVLFRSSVADDMAGVVGRMDTANANGTFYTARYEVAAGAWRMYKSVNGTLTQLGSTYAQALTAGQKYRVGLEMSGTTIRMLVNGVVRASATDSSISAAGRAGVVLGQGSVATTITDTTGMHLELVRVSPQMADVKNAGAGFYRGGALLSRSGAITGDSDTAAEFDVTYDRGFADGVALSNLSIEFWFRSASGTGTSANWYDAAALVSGDDSTAGAADWGVGLRSDGRVVAGVGNPDTSIVSTAGGYNNDAWHHAVFTWSSSGAMVLYVDGAQVATGTGPTAQRTVNRGIGFANNAEGTKALDTDLDEVALYNAVLPAAQVSEHYAARQ